jgi:hypothetical protein
MARAGDDEVGREARRPTVAAVVVVEYLLCGLLLLELKDDEEMVVVGLVVEGPLKLTLREAELFEDEEEDSHETDCVMRETSAEGVRVMF